MGKEVRENETEDVSELIRIDIVKANSPEHVLTQCDCKGCPAHTAADTIIGQQ